MSNRDIVFGPGNDNYGEFGKRKELGKVNSKPLPPLIQKLADAIEKADCKITFGLQPDQIQLIEDTIKEGYTMEYTFEKVAKAINWEKYTLACWYIKYLLK